MRSQNTSVTSIGGNQYKVTIAEETKIIDLDGVNIVDDEDYQRLKYARVDTDLYLTPEDHNATGEDNFFWEAAAKYKIITQGDIVTEVIANHVIENDIAELENSDVFRDLDTEQREIMFRALREYIGCVKNPEDCNLEYILGDILSEMDDSHSDYEVSRVVTTSGNPELISLT